MTARMVLVLLSSMLGTAYLAHAAGSATPDSYQAPSGQPSNPLPPGCSPSCPPSACTPNSTCSTQSARCPASGAGAAATDAWIAEFDADVLLWWSKASSIPPLVTTSATADLGILGAPSTTVVIGDREVNFDPRLGARFAGRLFIEEGWGVGLGGFFLENGSVRNAVEGLPVLAVPIIDPANGAEAAVRLAAPGAAVGSAALEMGSRFWGMDGNIICRIDDSAEWKVEAFAGFRFLQLVETLKLWTTSTVTGPGLFAGQVTPAGSAFVGLDSFGTRNSFYGGQIGGRLQALLINRLWVQIQAQIALGANERRVGIDGATGLAAPGLPAQFAPGNILTQTTNIGRITQDRIAYVPQASVGLGYQLTDYVRVMAGYDFLYWNSVVRPGDQIDRTVNPNLPPIQDFGARIGAARPERRLVNTDYWTQGLSFGVQVSY